MAVNKQMIQTLAKKLATGFLCTTSVVACSGASPDFGGAATDEEIAINQDISVFAARNPGAAGTEVDKYTTGDLRDTPTTATTNNNENIALDLPGNLIQSSGRSAANASLKVFCQAATRLDTNTNTTFDTATLDREIVNTGFTGPKGIAIAHQQGRVITTDNEAMEIYVHSTTASADRMPAALHTVSGVSAWDIVFDEANDRLFAALTNGQIAVFDMFLGSSPTAASRTITPTDSSNTPFAAPTNLHGIAFDGSRLVVTDVGAGASSTAGFDTDGSIYVFNDTSAFTSGGDTNVAASRVIEGPKSLLGNPVDITLDGNVLRVAEKANGGGQILIFHDIFTGGSGDIAPTKTVASAAVESIATRSNNVTLGADVSDLDTAATLNSITITQNPTPGSAMTPPMPPAALEGQISVLNSTSLAAKSDININEGMMTAVTKTRFLENIAYSQTGDAYATYDNAASPSAGGIIVINRLDAHSNADAQTTTDLDRVIEGSNTTLLTPKGIEVVDKAGIVIVADTFNDSAATPPQKARLVLFSTCVSGNATPIATTELNQPVWDIDYDPINDRLFAAGTMGEVLVWDNFLADQTANPMGGVSETRRIRPSVAGTPVSTNLHGIVYDATNDRLVVSDVGSAADPSDGRIYTIDAASTATGNTNVSREISGAASNLGNPVDIALNGTTLYVAEKSNDVLMQFDNIFTAQGSDPTTAPNASVAAVKPESVTLAPSTLGAAP